MVINLITIGKNMPDWVNDGFNEYQKRLPKGFSLNLIELPLEKRTKNSKIDKLKASESAALLAACQPKGMIITLDERGQSRTTHQLADDLNQWREQYRALHLLVGGPDGLSDEIKQQANLSWSLSGLTLPHPLVRVIIAEQIYRAYSIISGHPYHRD